MGESGKLTFRNINNYEWVQLEDSLSKTNRWQRPEQITGFEYQVRACAKAIAAGKIQTDEMPHSEIIKVMEIMDEIRRQCNVLYPFEAKIGQVAQF